MNHSTRTLLAFIGALAAGCGSESPTAPVDTNILGTTWHLRSIQEAGSAILKIPDRDRFTLSLEEDGRVSVRADCNVCSGRYELTNSSLRLTPMACTKAFCGTDSPDMRFLSALQPTTSVAITGGTLTIEAAGTVLVFVE
jgi:heat shock protein HslJ